MRKGGSMKANLCLGVVCIIQSLEPQQPQPQQQQQQQHQQQQQQRNMWTSPC